MRLPVDRFLTLVALSALSAMPAPARDRDDGHAGSGHAGAGHAGGVTGPAADYPVIVGDPYTIGSTVWTPIDQLNYDAVGYARTAASGVAGVTAAHKTLPLPSYVEVTALDTGRTILIRVERRGPMVNEALVELAPEAAEQLGLAAGSRSPIRIRRVNPPEQERALLRSGGRAPERMATPEGLLKVLRRKLADQSPLLPPPSAPPSMPAPPPAVSAAPKPAPAPTAATTTAATTAAQPSLPAPAKAAPTSKPPVAPAATGPVARPHPATAGTPSASANAPRGGFIVQVGAFSVEANARAVAARIAGEVSRAGNLWRVRMGPYTNRAQAAPALEKARAAGYRGARIQPAD